MDIFRQKIDPGENRWHCQRPSPAGVSFPLCSFFCAERKKIMTAERQQQNFFGFSRKRPYLFDNEIFRRMCVDFPETTRVSGKSKRRAAVKNFPASAGRGCRNCPVDILTFYILKFLQLKSSPERAFSSYWFKFSNINLY